MKKNRKEKKKKTVVIEKKFKTLGARICHLTLAWY